MSEIVVLRHAPTLWNAARRLQGRADVPLSDEGRALAAGWRLPADARGWPCLSSPLARALDTARLMGLSPEPDAALIEMDWGAAEGETLPALRAKGGAAFRAAEAAGLDFRPPGGETPREVGARLLSRLSRLSGSAVLVTHKGVLRALLALATGWDMAGTPPVRLLDGCCHRFGLGAGGRPRLLCPNIPLAPAGKGGADLPPARFAGPFKGAP